MAIAAGNHTAQAFTGVATATTTGILTQSAAGVYLVGVGWYSAAASLNTVNDNKGNGNYTNAVPAVNLSPTDAAFKSALYYVQNAAGGSGMAFSANFSGTVDVAALFVLEVTGALTSGALDQAPTGANTAHSDATPYLSNISGAIAQANELVFAMTNTYTTTGGPEAHTWNNSYSLLDSLTDPAIWTGASGYIITNSIGTQQSSLSATGATAIAALSLIATIKEGSAPSFGLSVVGISYATA